MSAGTFPTRFDDANGNATVAEYEWDGFSRRITAYTYASGVLDETRYFYYQGHSIIEERVDGTADGDLDLQYVWGGRYVDELIVRDRDTTGDGDPDERLYTLHDANFRVTVLVDENGDVAERYRYTAYGQRTALNPDWSDHADPIEGSYAFAIGHQGLMHDPTGLIYNRARMLHVTVGRFLQRDSFRYADGMGLYAYYAAVMGGLDPTGLEYYVDEFDEEMVESMEDLGMEVSLPDRIILQAVAMTDLYPLLPEDMRGAMSVFLNNQDCILRQLASDCCHDSEQQQWLFDVVLSFMRPFSESLKELAEDEAISDAEWRETFGAMRTGGGRLNRLLNGRDMALIHIKHDLRDALLEHGPGEDDVWSCIGDVVEDCMYQHTTVGEEFFGEALARVAPDFDIAKIRDEMRAEVVEELERRGKEW